MLLTVAAETTSPGFDAWISVQRQENCFRSVVSIGEIECGTSRKLTTDTRFARHLTGWLDQQLQLHGERLLPVDVGLRDAGVRSRPRSPTKAST